MQGMESPVELIDSIFQPVGVVPHAANGVAADRFVIIGYLRKCLAESLAALIELGELIAEVVQLFGE